MRTNQSDLIKVARKYGHAYASSWSALHHPDDGRVTVIHHGTVLFAVNADNTVTAISRGRGSQTDKCGTLKVLANVNGKRYADIFG